MTNAEVKRDAEDMIEYWKRELRIEDWEISVVDVPAHDPECCARTWFATCFGKAHIVIRNPELHPPDAASDSDLEITVVHELLHIRFHVVHFKKESAKDAQWELGIERTAQALVRARKGERRAP